MYRMKQMLNFNIIPVLIISLVLASCVAKKQSAQSKNNDILVIGYGGGFAGTVTEYFLNEEGVISKNANMEYAVSNSTKVQKDKLRQAYRNYFSLRLDTVKWHNPGNMYKYLVLRREGESDKKITWGNHDKSVPKEFDLYFDNIISVIKGLNISDKQTMKIK